MRMPLSTEEKAKRARCRRQTVMALYHGKIERQPCHCCGDLAEAHHVDYDEPLSIVWLCKPHHMETHRGPDGWWTPKDRKKKPRDAFLP